MSRGRSVVQLIADGVGNRRAVPLRKVLLILGIHGVQIRDRGTRKCCVVIPAEEGEARTRCRVNGDVRILNGISCDRVRIACRVTRRCTVV